MRVRSLGRIWLERSPAGGHSNPLQDSCLEKPIDRGAWRATVHRVAQSWTRDGNALACTHGKYEIRF